MATCVSCAAALPSNARFCPVCGTEQDGAKAALDERKLATVLFADLVGSTALADNEDPERVRARLERFYDAMAEEIERTGGTVQKFAGDAVMAVFGAPAALEDHAERALHAALAMRRRLSELFPELALRIGVNTGDLVVTAPREGSALVAGDAVNVGARLEQAATAGEVLAGERTVALAGGAFEFGDPRTVEAKGKPSGVVGRPVMRALSLARPRGASGFRRAFVGRETELDLLRATFRRAARGDEPHLVTIVGEPGVGKSRLVRELWERLSEEDPAPLRRTGRCLPYGDGITYWPLGEVVKEHFGLLESDSPDEAKRRLGEDQLLGLAIGLDVAGGLHPVEAHERLHEAAVRFFEFLAVERPVVILVEDVHWAEPDLLELLERVVREVRAPLVMVTTTRPELLDRRPTWGAGRRNATTIWLEPLAPDATALLLDELLSIALPADVRDLVVERAEGNPFFVEELLGSLVDDGVLERTDGTWRVNELPAGFAVPDSVLGVLAARIDRLPPTEKAALQAASVVGRKFWPGAVEHLLEGASPDFALLEERDFIRRSGGSSMAGEREYAIKHALTREVAYATIAKARRGPLHAMLAHWIEAAGAGRDEHASLLAYHYLEAVDPEDADLAWRDDPDELERLRGTAIAWLVRAAELAIRRYEILEGVSLLRRAIGLKPGRDTEARLWRRIGTAGALRYDAELVVEGFERAIEATTDPVELADLYSLLAFHTVVRSGMFKTRPDYELVQEWIDRAIDLSAPNSVQRGRALAAHALHDPSVGEDAARRASSIAEDLGDAELRSWAWDALAGCAFHQRRFQEARHWAERRFDVLDQIGDPDHTAEAYETVVPTVEALALFAEARRLADAHFERTRSLSSHHRLHSAALMVEVEELEGDWAEIIRLTPLVERATEENAATSCIRGPRSLLLCALAAEVSGQQERARELERIAAQYEHEDYGLSLSHPRLRLALMRGERDNLERLLEPQPAHRYSFGPGTLAAMLDALAYLRDRERIESEAVGLVGERTYVQPFALRALGIVREEEGLVVRARREFEALGLAWHAAQTDRLANGS